MIWNSPQSPGLEFPIYPDFREDGGSIGSTRGHWEVNYGK